MSNNKTVESSNHVATWSPFSTKTSSGLLNNVKNNNEMQSPRHRSASGNRLEAKTNPTGHSYGEKMSEEQISLTSICSERDLTDLNQCENATNAQCLTNSNKSTAGVYNVGGGDGEDDGDDTTCGLGGFTPKWMQIFASKQAFLVVFCITWVLQGMFYTYFVSVITTIEKLFQIQSKTTGLIMSATEIGQIGSSLLLTYYGGQGHRPKWIAWGMVLFAFSSFVCSLPHFIYGAQLIHANDLLFSGVASVVRTPYSDVNATTIPPNLCRAMSAASVLNVELDDHASVMSMSYPQKATLANQLTVVKNSHESRQKCEDDYLREHLIQSKVTTIVLAIFFISLLGVGMGQTAVYTLGIPYIDDNVTSRESPLYFAITIGVRIIGPALGFMLGSVCTRLYADLSVDPQISQTDPRWIGAWWLGLVLVAGFLMLASIAMFAFPKRLKKQKVVPPETLAINNHKVHEHPKSPSLRDFPKAVKRLINNDILIFRTASSVLHILPIAGIYTFLPKYIESQFRLPAHAANMISGVGGILVMGVGIVMSGLYILRWKPNARFVAAWIAATAVIYAIGMGILMFVGCPMNDFAGLQRHNGVTTFEPACDTTCVCDREKFSPVCGDDKRTYFSACHAGCRNLSISVEGKITEFSDCLCMSNVTEPNHFGTATIGYCDSDCGNFWWYIILFSIFVFVHSTSEVGSILLILRCVNPTDKAMALGLIQFAIGLFGNVPCPIIYGAVVDSACLVWEITCGEKGACWLYDTDVFRTFYHGTTGGLLLCAFFVDAIVWYKAGSISFTHDDEDEGQEDDSTRSNVRSHSI